MEKIAAFWFGPFLMLLLHIGGYNVISLDLLNQSFRNALKSKRSDFPMTSVHIQLDPDDVLILNDMNRKIEHFEEEIYVLPEREEILKRFGLGIDNFLRKRTLTPEHLDTLKHFGEEIAEIIQETEGLPKKKEVMKKIDKEIDGFMDKLLISAGFFIEVPLNENISILETFLKQMKPHQNGELIFHEDFPKIQLIAFGIQEEIDKGRLGGILSEKGHRKNFVLKAEYILKIRVNEEGKKFLRRFAKEIGKLINEIREDYYLELPSPRWFGFF